MSSLHLPASTGLPGFTAGAEPTMSSREIADLCGARHNDVVETILRLFEKGVLRESRNTPRSHQPAGGGRPTEVYDLTKRDTLVVVSGYSDEVRARIIDRWIELEAGHPALPRDYPTALRDLASAVERIGQQQAQIAVMAPKAAALDKLAAEDGMILISDAAKHLDMPIHELFDWLRANRWIFRRTNSKRDIAYADKLSAGLLKHRYHAVPQGDGTETLKARAMLTPKGVARLGHIFSKQAT